MLDLKQLKYFVVSAEVGGFSEAARVLYTTQSNVSKGITALEKKLGVVLFYREARGVSLTPGGRRVYRSARQILDSAEDLENRSIAVEAEWLHISANPGGWFPRLFADFYNRYQELDPHVHVKISSTREVLKRVSDGRDELGFVCLMETEQEDIAYLLHRSHLEFEAVCRGDAALYCGAQSFLQAKQFLENGNSEELRLVQMYQDELTGKGTWKCRDDSGSEIQAIHTSIITNSEALTRELLVKTNVAAIGPQHYVGFDSDPIEQIRLSLQNGSLNCGYIKRKDEKISVWGERLCEFIKEKSKG